MTGPVADPIPTANELIWVQFELNGANRQFTMSTHPDQAAEPTSGWTAISTSTAGSATGTIYAGTNPVRIGAWSSGSQWLVADVFQLTLRNSSGTKVFQLDPDEWTTGSTWTTSTGHTVTLGSTATIETE